MKRRVIHAGTKLDMPGKRQKKNTWVKYLVLAGVVFSSCEKEVFEEKTPPQAEASPMVFVGASDYSMQVNTQNQMQKITQWGHDIKQDNKAANLTVAACQQIFQNGKFNLLRIPIYGQAHNPDGSVKEDYLVRMAPVSVQDNTTKWEIIPAQNDWFYIRNTAYNQYIKGFDDDAVEIAPTTNTGSWTQWKLVDAGDGWSYIKSRGLQKYMRGKSNNAIHLTDATSTGVYTQWKLVDTGDGYRYIENRGHNTYIQAGGNPYEAIVDAINRAKSNGNPDLYASHKIYDSQDFRTYHNVNFGPFYTTNGIDATGFASAIDAFIDYIYAQTGKTIKYLAPRCELGNHWTTDDFIQVVSNLTHSPLIVSPEAANCTNSVDWWPAVSRVTDVKSTHNKELAPDWPAGAEFNWNGETIGGNSEKFYRLINEFNQSFYKGKVTGVVFWGDPHLNNTNEDNNNGPFRRELVEASSYPLVQCDTVSYSYGAAAIAFKTDTADKTKIFYGALGTVNFTFDGILNVSSIPADATGITGSSFIMNATGSQDYRSFTVKTGSTAIDMVSTGSQGGDTQWEKIPSEGEWFYLRNKAYDHYAKGFDNDCIRLAYTDNTGTWTQWKLVDAGEGWYHLENRGFQKYMRGQTDNTIHLADKTSTGTWTQWKLVDTGNGYYYIQNRGHNKNLQAGKG
ncbi:RICIN domain-containing protein [Sinomicrobium weinanense]|uniref:RICIN domain-containing protein n=1 Tax=Sinomicrobium weinanense TaxID=2842200 RepID=A0A926Q4R3_9FLAO|nr:RICIN domain-containing protein [Sinomicrobium weinanense]MBC9797170.1 RICIN domain-containing protein [Sinomicrobium weinanense]MBU3125854.1 RICIN domain-containing protein [Sinomicrobium weinanense]